MQIESQVDPIGTRWIGEHHETQFSDRVFDTACIRYEIHSHSPLCDARLIDLWLGSTPNPEAALAALSTQHTELRERDLDLGAVFALIETMPMRVQEMRAQESP